MPSWRLCAPQRLVYIRQTQKEIFTRMNQHRENAAILEHMSAQKTEDGSHHPTGTMFPELNKQQHLSERSLDLSTARHNAPLINI